MHNFCIGKLFQLIYIVVKILYMYYSAFNSGLECKLGLFTLQNMCIYSFSLSNY